MKTKCCHDINCIDFLYKDLLISKSLICKLKEISDYKFFVFTKSKFDFDLDMESLFECLKVHEVRYKEIIKLRSAFFEGELELFYEKEVNQNKGKFTQVIAPIKESIGYYIEVES